MRVIILCLLFLIPTALAEDKGIFYILDEKFINNISELPYSAGTPETNRQASGYIHAWIDITGFKQMSRDNGIDYIPGRPADLAIVQYDAKAADVPGSVTKIDKSIMTYQSNNSTIAVLTVDLYWKSTICDENSCWEVPYHETAQFRDTEISPVQYKPISQELKVNITQYNNSLYENIGIRIIIPPGLLNIKLNYQNKTATHRLSVGHVEQTSKGVYFANITSSDAWNIQGSDISRLENTIFMNGNLSTMNLSDIKITGSNLYETRTMNSSQFNITRLEFKPEKELENPVLMWFMSVMAVMAGGIFLFIQRMRLQWI
jgi:hypothetical protein